jgi:Holliday junction resolvasome RuvABC endonuclease subunit
MKAQKDLEAQLAAAPQYFIGIDPGTGRRSKLGIVIVEALSMRIVAVRELATSEFDIRTRLRELSMQYLSLLKESKIDMSKTVAFIESFVIKGKGGETLQRLVGALMAITPGQVVAFKEVPNLQVKLETAGFGHAEKTEVAMGLLNYFIKHNPESASIVQALMASNNYDALDALAIGLTGWKKSYGTNMEITAKREKQKKSKPLPP